MIIISWFKFCGKSRSERVKLFLKEKIIVEYPILNYGTVHKQGDGTSCEGSQIFVKSH